MKRLPILLLSFSLCLISFSTSAADIYSINRTVKDSIHAQTKAEKKEKGKQELKESGYRLVARVNYVYAKLHTTITFDVVNTIFSATIGLESNFKLPDTKLFFTASFIYRFTRRSGIYATYYGITRSKTFTTDQDYIFLGVTIPAGVSGKAFFDTRVLSVGYLLTILEKEHAFLGAYFNIYVMNLSTGFKAEDIDINEKLALTVPLPSFGLVAVFPVKKWFKIHANVGFFALTFENVGGHINSFDLGVEFKPIRWLGINLSYQSFDINVNDLEKHIKYVVDYNFRGPALGITLNF
jgi:hypothetical protein